MKITTVTTVPFSLPLKRAIGFAHGSMASTDHVLVEIGTDEGLTGRAEAPSRPYLYGESLASMAEAVRQWFRPQLVGMDPFRTDTIRGLLDRTANNNTIKGAIDIALHDLIGQAVGQPCFKLLGGHTDRVRVTYVCGYSTPQEMADECAQVNQNHGITAFKVKVGVDQRKDEASLSTIRERLPDSLIYVDGNEAFSEKDALRMLAMAAEHRVAWAEEPCPAADTIARRRVAEHSAIPILGDDSCRTLSEVMREARNAAIHLVSIKVARTGYRLSRDILGLAAAHGIRPLVGSQGDSGMGVLAGAHFCAAHRATSALPAELCFHLNLAADILVETPPIVNGELLLGSRPGLGLEIDVGKLAHHRIDL
jgi:L-alanine-DL-glutamate epimerase-like enolase superfamily enzyme